METLRKKEEEGGRKESILGGLTRKRESTIEEVLRRSTFTIERGSYVYAKVGSMPERWDDHFMVSKDGSEITVVTREENLRNLDLLERKSEAYALIGLSHAAPLYTAGFLAAIGNEMAKSGISILPVSTYSKSYILINPRHLDAARKALNALGLKEMR